MREIFYSSQFKKDLKKVISQGKNIEELDSVIKLLQQDIPLPAKYNDHPLKGEFKGARDCHINPDWILIYRKPKKDLQIISLIRTGSHSDLY